MLAPCKTHTCGHPIPFSRLPELSSQVGPPRSPRASRGGFGGLVSDDGGALVQVRGWGGGAPSWDPAGSCLWLRDPRQGSRLRLRWPPGDSLGGCSQVARGSPSLLFSKVTLRLSPCSCRRVTVSQRRPGPGRPRCPPCLSAEQFLPVRSGVSRALKGAVLTSQRQTPVPVSPSPAASAQYLS